MSQGVSLRPEDAATGGTLDAVEAVITKVRAVGEYPNGTPALLLAVSYAPTTGAKERTELYSMGKVQLKPSADGKEFVEITKDSGARPHKNSSGMQFFLAMITAGFPADDIKNDVSVVEGTTVFLRAKARPKTGNADIDKNNEGKTITLPERVIALPGAKVEKKAAPAAKKPVAAAKKAEAPAPVEDAPAAAAKTDEEYEADAVEIVADILGHAKPTFTVARNRIGSEVFQYIAKTKPPVPGAIRSKLMAAINAPGFYTAEGRPWYADEEAKTLVGQPPVEEAEAA